MSASASTNNVLSDFSPSETGHSLDASPLIASLPSVESRGEVIRGERISTEWIIFDGGAGGTDKEAESTREKGRVGACMPY